jgi:hypothetical protein
MGVKMTKPSKMPERCRGTPIDYCYIARPKLRQIGIGYKMECPVCGRRYDFIVPPEKMTPEERQRVIDSTYIP